MILRLWGQTHLLVSFLPKKESEVAQSCPTLCDPMDCSLPGSSIHGIFQARILEWVAISFSRGSSRPRDRTWSPTLQAYSLPSEPSGEVVEGYKRSVCTLFATYFESILTRSYSVESFQSHGLQHARPLSITNSWGLLKLISIESVMPSNHLILCHPLLLPSIFPSIRIFSNESVLHIRWPKYWCFSFSISPSDE